MSGEKECVLLRCRPARGRGEGLRGRAGESVNDERARGSGKDEDWLAGGVKGRKKRGEREDWSCFCDCLALLASSHPRRGRAMAEVLEPAISPLSGCWRDGKTGGDTQDSGDGFGCCLATCVNLEHDEWNCVDEHDRRSGRVKALEEVEGRARWGSRRGDSGWLCSRSFHGRSWVVHGVVEGGCVARWVFT